MFANVETNMSNLMNLIVKHATKLILHLFFINFKMNAFLNVHQHLIYKYLIILVYNAMNLVNLAQDHYKHNAQGINLF